MIRNTTLSVTYRIGVFNIVFFDISHRWQMKYRSF